MTEETSQSAVPPDFYHFLVLSSDNNDENAKHFIDVVQNSDDIRQINGGESIKIELLREAALEDTLLNTDEEAMSNTPAVLVLLTKDFQRGQKDKEANFNYCRAIQKCMDLPQDPFLVIPVYSPEFSRKSNVGFLPTYITGKTSMDFDPDSPERFIKRLCRNFLAKKKGDYLVAKNKIIQRMKKNEQDEMAKIEMGNICHEIESERASREHEERKHLKMVELEQVRRGQQSVVVQRVQAVIPAETAANLRSAPSGTTTQPIQVTSLANQVPQSTTEVTPTIDSSDYSNLGIHRLCTPSVSPICKQESRESNVPGESMVHAAVITDSEVISAFPHISSSQMAAADISAQTFQKYMYIRGSPSENDDCLDSESVSKSTGAVGEMSDTSQDLDLHAGHQLSCTFCHTEQTVSCTVPESPPPQVSQLSSAGHFEQDQLSIAQGGGHYQLSSSIKPFYVPEIGKSGSGQQLQPFVSESESALIVSETSERDDWSPVSIPTEPLYLPQSQ